MHGSAGLHSAMAIKRQRAQREQLKRRAERRLSSRTDDSEGSMEHLPTKRISPQAQATLATSIGMLHLGICFSCLGIILIGSGLLPDDLLTWRSGGWFNEMVMTGVFVTFVGLFLLLLNYIVSKREEVELEDYVASQLTRSRSGHRLERDHETGCLTTKSHRRMLEQKREDKERGLEELAPVHSPLSKIAPPNAINADPYLEKILEEDILEREEIRLDLRETISNTTTASLSPGTPSETRELIVNGRQYSFNSRQY